MQSISKGAVDTGNFLAMAAFESKTANNPKTLSFDKMLQESAEVKSQSDQSDTSYHRTKGLPKVSKDNITADNSKEVLKSPVKNDNSTSDTKSVSGETEKQDLNSQAESITKAVEEMKETIVRTLSITEEELTEFMSILGLSMLDLLNPERLKQLTLASAGAEDITILLTDETLNQALNQLLQALDQIMDQCGIEQENILALQSMEQDFAALTSQPQEELSTDEPADVAGSSHHKVQEQVLDTEEESTVDFEFSAVKQNDTSNTNQSTDTQEKHQTSEKQIAPGEQFLNQLTQTVTTTRTDFTNTLTTIEEVRNITNQIVEQIKVVIKPSQSTMDMMLNPEHLGRVQLNISSKEGVLTASFITQTEAAKEAIESQIQVLKENLEAQGLKVEEMEVTVANFSFHQNSQMDGQRSNDEQAGAKANKVLRVDGFDDEPAEEEEAGNQNVLTGSNFDTSA